MAAAGAASAGVPGSLTEAHRAGFRRESRQLRHSWGPHSSWIRKRLFSLSVSLLLSKRKRTLARIATTADLPRPGLFWLAVSPRPPGGNVGTAFFFRKH